MNDSVDTLGEGGLLILCDCAADLLRAIESRCVQGGWFYRRKPGSRVDRAKASQGDFICITRPELKPDPPGNPRVLSVLGARHVPTPLRQSIVAARNLESLGTCGDYVHPVLLIMRVS